MSAVSYVDRVVPVDFSNTYKIDAWKRYHYDCHFSGNDYGADWTRDLEQLREVGADMEFFEYTTATSSTAIRGKMDCKFRSNGTPIPKSPGYLFRYSGMNFPHQRYTLSFIIVM